MSKKVSKRQRPARTAAKAKRPPQKRAKPRIGLKRGQAMPPPLSSNAQDVQAPELPTPRDTESTNYHAIRTKLDSLMAGKVLDFSIELAASILCGIPPCPSHAPGTYASDEDLVSFCTLAHLALSTKWHQASLEIHAELAKRQLRLISTDSYRDLALISAKIFEQKLQELFDQAARLGGHACVPPLSSIQARTAA
jgi:hypothetical protein